MICLSKTHGFQPSILKQIPGNQGSGQEIRKRARPIVLSWMVLGDGTGYALSFLVIFVRNDPLMITHASSPPFSSCCFRSLISPLLFARLMIQYLVTQSGKEEEQEEEDDVAEEVDDVWAMDWSKLEWEISVAIQFQCPVRQKQPSEVTNQQERHVETGRIEWCLDFRFPRMSWTHLRTIPHAVSNTLAKWTSSPNVFTGVCSRVGWMNLRFPTHRVNMSPSSRRVKGWACKLL